MTPIEIEVLLQLYHAPMSNPPVSGIQAEAVSNFIGEGLAVVDGAGHAYIAALGRAHVRQLCDLPIPTQVYVNSHGEVIDIEDNAQ